MRIALFLNNLDEEYQISIYQAVRKRSQEIGIDLLCMQQNPFDGMDSKAFFEALPQNFINVDGVLILSSVLIRTQDFSIPQSFTDFIKGIPLVSIGLGIPDIPSVAVQRETPLKDLIKHLVIDHGYRSFLFMGGSLGQCDNDARKEIVDQELAKYKKSFPEISIVYSFGAFNENSGTQRMEAYITKSPCSYIDAVIAANDTIAIGVQRYLQMQSDPRWKKCAVTGFDDIPNAKFEEPPLTTIRQPIDQLGVVGVDKLLSLIKGESTELLSCISTELRIRQSCGCDSNSPFVYCEDSSFVSGYNYDDSIFQFKTQLIKSEQDIRTISYFGQHMNSVRRMTDLLSELPSFLNTMRVKTFYLVLFSKSERNQYGNGSIVFERRNFTSVVDDGSASGKCKTYNLQKLIERAFEQETEAGKTVCLRYLISGTKCSGFVLYETNDFSQPYICAATIFLANTIHRLQQLEAEQKHSQQLEVEVKERTRELENAHKKLEEESRRRIRIEAEVLKISELERQRFSMDLHDDICQRLAGISMIARNMANYNPDLEDLSQLIDETLSRTRQYAHDSFPMELQPLGLHEALGTLCHTIEAQSDCKIYYRWQEENQVVLSSTKLINIYRIIQEALTNVMKHSHATKASVVIETNKTTMRVSVQDNGIGNSAVTGRYQKKRKGFRKGIGLRSMQYRADQIGAKYRFTSSEQNGTLVELKIPLTVKTEMKQKE